MESTVSAPRNDVLAALRRHWVLPLLSVTVLLAVAAALGYTRPARYTATAHLSVGGVYVNNPAGVASVVEARQSLASVYSRAIQSSAVQNDIARRLERQGVAPVAKLMATPVPESPLVKVSAESSSQAAAVAGANTASDALIAYVDRELRITAQAGTIADRYRAASLQFRQRLSTRERLERRYASAPTSENRAARDRAAAAVDAALLRREALHAAYQNAILSGSSGPTIEVFSRAGTPTSDRWPMLQTVLFAGLIGGLAAGTALALLRGQRDVRRPRAQ